MTTRRTPKPVIPITRGDLIAPFRDRTVPVRKVSCPACGAEPGEMCIAATGKPTTSNHPARRRKAIREGL